MSATRDLAELQEHLFGELDRLASADADSLDAEVRRAEAIVGVGKVMVENANTAIKATYLADGFIKTESRLPKMLES